MTLTLRIDNYDLLEDGGPAWITLDRKGASVGRSRAMDWVLPDPAKHISGHHFEIAFHDGGYWLSDMSTNGTFLEGQRHRLDGQHLLTQGDRLVVGHYIITAQIASGAAPPLQAPPVGDAPWGDTPRHDDEDPWDFGAGSLDPVNPMPPQRSNPHHLDDMAHDFVPLQRPNLSAAPQVPTRAQPPGPARFADGGPPPSVPPVQQPQVSPQTAQAGGQPVAVPMPPLSPMAPAATPMMPPQPQPMITGPAAPPLPPVAPSSGEAEILRAFCDGAGLNPALLARTDALTLAHELGRSVRVTTEEIMRLLQDRANVKHFTKGGERTMRSATGNNPLKFLPDGDQALDAMFLNPRDGFMTGADGIENALKDVRQHQMAVFAALQPALAQVLAGLSPDEIEAAGAAGAGNLLGGSRRSRAWDRFVERWDEKAGAGDHGMLDAFLKAFARAYAEANARGGVS